MAFGDVRVVREGFRREVHAFACEPRGKPRGQVEGVGKNVGLMMVGVGHADSVPGTLGSAGCRMFARVFLNSESFTYARNA